MANVFIRRDRLQSTVKVWLEGYPSTPTWSTNYTGTAWIPGDFHGTVMNVAVKIPDYFENTYGYTGGAWMELSQNGSSLSLENPFDVSCQGGLGTSGCIPGVEIKGSSTSLLDTVFNTDGKISMGISGPQVPANYGETKFILYDWTAGTVIAESVFGNYDLVPGHVYRFRWYAKFQGTGDPMEPPLVNISFNDSLIVIPGAPSP